MPESHADRPRRQFLVELGAVAVVVGVAGCSSDGDGGDPNEGTSQPTATENPTATPTEEPEPSETEPETETDAKTETETASNVEAVEIPTYEFVEGETYVYETTFAEERTAETWSVESVDGDELTVARATEVGGEQREQTISGTHSSIYDDVEEARDISFFPLIRSALRIPEMGELTPGTSYTIRRGQFPNSSNIEWETAEVQVTEEGSVGGVDCTEFTVNPDTGEQTQTVCVADDYPFALSLAISQNDETFLEMTLDGEGTVRPQD